MLLHLRPSLLADAATELVDFHLAPLDLYLRGGVHLAARRPFPGTRMSVACRNEGPEATNGILIETAKRVSIFHTRTRWAINAQFVVTHVVTYLVLDDVFDAASDDMSLWRDERPERAGHGRARWQDLRLPSGEPVMEVTRGIFARRSTDRWDARGFIAERHQELLVPSIERDRITTCPPERKMPSLRSAFRVDADATAEGRR